MDTSSKFEKIRSILENICLTFYRPNNMLLLPYNSADPILPPRMKLSVRANGFSPHIHSLLNNFSSRGLGLCHENASMFYMISHRDFYASGGIF